MSRLAIVISFVIATLIAAIIFVIFILPAEFNIDVTGLGEEMGLTALAPPPNPLRKETLSEQRPSLITHKQDTTAITIPAGDGIEYKFQLLRGNHLRYEWTANGELFFDLHAEPTGDLTGYFESFVISTAASAKGSIVARFNGTHGWYWRNDTDRDITVTLQTAGNYAAYNQ